MLLKAFLLAGLFRLFVELEEINRALDKKVTERTAELELKSVQLEKAKNDALQAANAKAQFLSNMSHEIRTPVSQVITAAELLTDTDLTDDGREYANVIISSGKLLLSLLNDILDCSKLESGKVKIEQIKFDLFQTVQICVDAFTVEQDLRLGYYFPPDLDHFMIGDGTRVRQILTNLVSNAIKFTAKGYVLLFLSSTMLGDHVVEVEFKVIDTGIGIAEDKRKSIFERFEQESASITRNYGGTGLGLSICRGLCELMGSNISVMSELGKGSMFEFSIRFPLASHAIHPARSEFAHVLNSGPRVLVIEDKIYQYNSKTVLDYQLETFGAAVDRGSFAPPSTSQRHFELIIIDTSSFQCSTFTHEVHLAVSTWIALPVPVLLIHNNDQDKLIQSYCVRSHVPITRCLSHPYKQSTLYRIVKQMLDSFSSFRLTACLERDLERKLYPEKSIKNAEEHPKPPIDILVVEDNLINQKVLKAMLSKLGYQSDVAENGQIAVNMAKEKDYDIIFMDVHMPIMDGLDATRQIRRHHKTSPRRGEEPFLVSPTPYPTTQHGETRCDYPYLPDTAIHPFIVGLSADALSENKKEGINVGMNRFLTKPVSKDEIKEIISLVEQSRRS